MLTPIPFPARQDNNIDLSDSVILITGACGGIGSVLSKAFAKQGATIVLLDKDLKALEKLYDEIEQNGAPQPAIYPLDLAGATANHYEELAQVIQKELGQLDAIVHCATMMGTPTLFEQSDIETWYKVMQVNLNGPYMLTSLCIPLLKASAHGRIVFTVDDKNGAYWDAYGVSKAALLGLTEQLAAEYDGTALKVNAINPGQTRTHLHVSAYPAGDYAHLHAPEAHVNDYAYLVSKQLEHNGALFSKAQKT